MDCFTCKETFSSFDCFKTHINESHKTIINFCCTRCSKYRNFSCKYSFFRHIKLHFNRSFSSQSEESVLLTSNEYAYTHTHELLEPDLTHPLVDLETEISKETNNSNNSISKSYQTYINDKSLDYISNLYDNVGLCRSTIDMCVKETSQFLATGTVSYLKNTVMEKITGLDQETKDEIKLMFDMLETPFSKFQTDYMRSKAFEERNVFIKPIKHAVGDRLDPVCVDNQIILNPKLMYLQHIPLRVTLKSFLETTNTFNTVLDFINGLNGQTDESSNFMESHSYGKRKDYTLLKKP